MQGTRPSGTYLSVEAFFMRAPEPWFRKQNKTWYVEIARRQINLGKDKRLATDKFRKLMADYQPAAASSRHTVRQVVEAYWEWLKRNRAESTCTRRHPILESSASRFVPGCGRVSFCRSTSSDG